MPINIREILYPGDSDQIKWDKINYNFDQIVTNGGKTGPAGTKGDVGPAGITGNTGDKGDKGEVGAKGEIGNTTNFWDQLPHGNSDTFVLKPIDGSTGNETAIFIGDTTYENGVNNGNLAQDAQLVVKNSPGFSYAQAFLPADNAAASTVAGKDALTIAGDYSADWDGTGSGPGTIWNIVPQYSASHTNRRLNIRADMLDLSGDDLLKITGGNRGIVVSASTTGGTTGLTINTTTGINAPTDINNTLNVVGATTLQNTLLVQGNNSSFTGTGSILIPNGSTSQRPTTPSAGMIRFNTQSLKFEGYGGAGSWLDFNRLSNANKTTYVSVESDSDYQYTLANQIRFIAGSSVIANMSSTGFYIDKDVYINNASGGASNDLYFRGPASGIIYPAGGSIPGIGSQLAGLTYYNSPSNGSSESLRNLNDYFYQESYFPETKQTRGGIHHDGTYFVGIYNASATGNKITWIDDGGGTYWTKNNDSKVTWTKIGNQVIVNGSYKFKPEVQNWSTLGVPYTPTVEADQQLILGLGEPIGTSTEKAQFPFRNDTGQPIHVNVNTYYFGYAKAGEFGGLRGLYGMIFPGENYIRLYYTNTIEGTGSTATITYHSFEPVAAHRLREWQNTDGIFLFNFTMPTNVNTGKNSYGSATTIGGGGSTLGGGFTPL